MKKLQALWQTFSKAITQYIDYVLGALLFICAFVIWHQTKELKELRSEVEAGVVNEQSVKLYHEQVTEWAKLLDANYKNQYDSLVRINDDLKGRIYELYETQKAINTKYNEKVNTVTHLTPTSGVHFLSGWLSKTDTVQRR